MKNYFIKIFLLFALISGFRAYGQPNYREAKYKLGDTALNKFLNKKFAEESRKYNWPSCIVSAVFAKFYIDSVGNIKNLTFSDLKGAPEIFRTMLTTTIL